MRRTVYELLAEFGYKDGVVPYISNMYKDAAKNSGYKLSDTFILNKIFKGNYSNLKEFKNKMFERRIHNLSKLKEIEIEWEGKTIKVNNIKLEELMKNAVNKDLELINQIMSDMENKTYTDINAIGILLMKRNDEIEQVIRKQLARSR